MEIVTSWMEVGIDQEAKKIVTRQIKRRLGEIAPEIENRINQLSIDIVEDLAMDYLDFKTENDLINWLDSHKN